MNLAPDESVDHPCTDENLQKADVYFIMSAKGQITEHIDRKAIGPFGARRRLGIDKSSLVL